MRADEHDARGTRGAGGAQATDDVESRTRREGQRDLEIRADRLAMLERGEDRLEHGALDQHDRDARVALPLGTQRR